MNTRLHSPELWSRTAAQSENDPLRSALAETIGALADAAIEIQSLVQRGPLGGALGASTGDANSDGDVQKTLDVLANDIVLNALRTAPVAYFASEEENEIHTLAPEAQLGVAVDPLDGSSNIDVNVSIGTIFSIFAKSSAGATTTFFRPGREQLAAGYMIYGPHTALVLTTGQGVDLYVLDPEARGFRLASAGLRIGPDTKEFAINASNYRHWSPAVRMFIDDCLQGADGPRGKNFNMRWVASLVAETHRIFSRGGVFLYPADARPGYQKGRLRLIYEAAPIAMLVEQAGGAATDGAERILDLVPSELHQRTPFIFGAAQKVDRVAAYHRDAAATREASPLFAARGLFRS
ncbi:MAG: class 1 fructose-bisphosphatase [Neomegalonema sp.]|nr:class 1 fructose-bisphosphatase [Neomegalonema sp.]